MYKHFLQIKSKRCHESLAAWFSKKNFLNSLGKRKNGILYKNKHFKNCKIHMKSLATMNQLKLFLVAM